MQRATVFSDSPAAQAKKFEQDGFNWLHLVDLNGAFAGQPVNEQAVRAILSQCQMPVQLGGGIRDLARIATWLDAGVNRVILGTVAQENPELVKQACKAHPGKIVVGIDARGGLVAINGWAEITQQKAVDLVRHYEDVGVAAIIYTDIARDGQMAGPNIEETVALAQQTHIPIIASGGISSNADIAAYKTHESDGIEGVIIGRALYDGVIDIAQALRAAC